MRVAVVVAHPDDETVGFAARLTTWRPDVIVLTDGAPRDPWFAREAGFADREAYARARADELQAALRLAGIASDRIHRCDVADQEAVEHLALLAERVRGVVRGADLVATHAYEGGHPDHDAAAAIVHAVAATLAPRPTILEASFYHDAFGDTVYGRFVPAAGAGAVESLGLSPEALTQKRAMLACYGTQAAVLSRFDATVEAVRIAPRYDFAAPPHPGRLHYERWGWPIDGARFRARVASAALL